MSNSKGHEQNPDHSTDATDGSLQGFVQHAKYPHYLPNVVAAIAASVGVAVGSFGPWVSLAWVTANGATVSAWWQGKTTFILGVVAGIALFTLLNRAGTGSGTRWLVPLAWIAPVAGLACLLIAIISIIDVTTTSYQLVGLQLEWGVWLVAISAVVLCATASVAAAQVGTVTHGSKAGVRTVMAMSALVLLGVALYFPIRWAAINPRPSGNSQSPIAPRTSVPSAQSTPPVPIRTTATPSSQDPEVAEVRQLWQTSLHKHHPVQDFLAAVQAAGIVGMEPALLDNGYRVCGELWKGGYDGVQAAVALQKHYPTMSLKQAAHFVLAAAENLCPTSAYSGVYEWWQSGGGAGAGGGAAAAGG